MPQLADGYSTLVYINALSLPLIFKLWAKTVTPVGTDGGGSIPLTTMNNTTYRTFAPKMLVTLTEMTFTAAYDPVFYTNAGTTFQLGGYLNRNCPITVYYPDGSSLVFYGWLDKIQPQENTEGNQPLVTCTIVPSMNNGAVTVNNQGKSFFTVGVEVAPVYTAGP
jgi:hypothetical protein